MSTLLRRSDDGLKIAQEEAKKAVQRAGADFMRQRTRDLHEYYPHCLGQSEGTGSAEEASKVLKAFGGCLLLMQVVEFSFFLTLLLLYCIVFNRFSFSLCSLLL